MTTFLLTFFLLIPSNVPDRHGNQVFLERPVQHVYVVSSKASDCEKEAYNRLPTLKSQYQTVAINVGIVWRCELQNNRQSDTIVTGN